MKIWTSNPSRVFKMRIFIAAIVTIPLHGCKAWTLTATLSKSLDGCYTRMLWVVFNINWQQHITNWELYGDLPKVSDKISARRLKPAGHCLWHLELPASSVVFWEPTYGRKGPRQPKLWWMSWRRMLKWQTLTNWGPWCRTRMSGESAIMFDRCQCSSTSIS